MIPFALRPYQESDADFVIGHWIAGAAKMLPVPMHGQQLELWRAMVERRLARSTSAVIINPDDADQRMGFLCYDLHEQAWLVLHWIYVWGPCRRNGLAVAALNEAVPDWQDRLVIGTGMSRSAGTLARKHGALLCALTEAA